MKEREKTNKQGYLQGTTTKKGLIPIFLSATLDLKKNEKKNFDKLETEETSLTH